MHQDDLIRALGDLAKEPPRAAPPIVKTRTLAAYRAHFRRRRYLRMSWTAAAAAVLTIALLIPQRQVRTRPTAFPTPDLTSFVMLDDEPIGTGLVVRVKLPLSAFGDSPLVETADTREVEADVLLGEDGLAHGIRLVI